MESSKPIHSIILDAAPLLTNEPSISTLIAKSEQLFTTPSVLAEIKDATARNRLETTVIPFLTVRTPTAASVKVVSDFARKTGDLVVLSRTDVQVLALAYEIECERNQGDWRLRTTPGQKRVNGPPPKPEPNVAGATDAALSENGPAEAGAVVPADSVPLQADDETNAELEGAEEAPAEPKQESPPQGQEAASNSVLPELASLAISEPEAETQTLPTESTAQIVETVESSDQTAPIEGEGTKQDDLTTTSSPQEDIPADSDSDSEGWITPSNLTRHQHADSNPHGTPNNSNTKPPSILQAAVITTDFALQNTLLQMNLNLLSTTLTRISHIKSHILRCHACFSVTKDLSKQFCPKCGQPSLTRVTCSTNATTGEFKLHLKKNIQWSQRGNRYSVPKPVAGTSSGKLGKGGRNKCGKGGWGSELILAEDQKEYVRAVAGQERERRRERDLMDEDFLPSILTGEGRRGGNGRIVVGAGRNVNSKKR